jgi:DNA replication protein DnaD
VKAVDLSIACRKAGVKATPADPRLIELASQGVSIDTMAAACEEAKRNGSDNLGYAVKVLATWAREAGAMRVAGTTQQRQSGHQSEKEQAREWAAKLTGKNRHEQRDTPEFIDLNPAPGMG